MPFDEKISRDKLNVKILSENDNVSEFCCSVKEIDDFIREEALDFQNERLGVTYVCYHKSELVGFVTLSMADLKKERMEAADRLPIGRENYPALQISQIAVIKDLQQGGIGTYLCDFCLDKANKFSEKVGCRFLVLNAIQTAITFYENYGFKLLKGQKNRREPIMFLNIFGRLETE